jgi:O-antigen ligase
MVVLLPWRLRLVLVARPSPPIYGDYTDFMVFAGDCALIVTLVAGAISHIRSRAGLRLGPPLLSLALGGVIVASALSAITSQDLPGSFYHLVRLLLLAGLYLFLINHSLGWKWIVIPVGAQVGIQAAVGIAQSLRQTSLGLSLLGEHALDAHWPGVSVVLSESRSILRAYGLSDHPNIAGGCFALGALALIAAAIRTRGPRQLWSVALAGMSLVGLLVTFSRAASLAFAAGFIVLAAGVLASGDRGGRSRLLHVTGAASLLLVPFVLHFAPALSARAGIADPLRSNPLESRSLNERSALNEAAAQIFLDHPWTGVGIGALPVAMQARYPDLGYPFQPAHLVWLDAAAETGAAGGLLYLLATVAPWIALAAPPRRASLSPGLWAASAALITITVIGFFDYYPWLLTPGRLLQWSVWGVWAREFLRSSSAVVPGAGKRAVHSGSALEAATPVPTSGNGGGRREAQKSGGQGAGARAMGICWSANA